MNPRDYSQSTCSCLLRCGDFTCNRKMPDQKKIYMMQAMKKAVQENRKNEMNKESDSY